MLEVPPQEVEVNPEDLWSPDRNEELLKEWGDEPSSVYDERITRLEEHVGLEPIERQAHKPPVEAPRKPAPQRSASRTTTRAKKK